MTDPTPELDIRWPIGLLFTLVGLAVAAYGAIHFRSPDLRPLGLNLDFWWGLAMLLFGLAMNWGAYRAGRRPE